MKVYRTDEIRNVVLLGHGGSGKTSLAGDALRIRCNESYGKDFRIQYGERF